MEATLLVASRNGAAAGLLQLDGSKRAAPAEPIRARAETSGRRTWNRLGFKTSASICRPAEAISKQTLTTWQRATSDWSV